jgi:hypothetical protein
MSVELTPKLEEAIHAISSKISALKQELNASEALMANQVCKHFAATNVEIYQMLLLGKKDATS